MRKTTTTRRIFTLAAVSVAAFVAMSGVATATTSGISYSEYECRGINPPARCGGVPVSHVGWVFLNLNHCPAGLVCAQVYRDSMFAWRYTYRQDQPFVAGSLKQGWTYVSPAAAYGPRWRWAYQQHTGWHLTDQGRFEQRSY